MRFADRSMTNLTKPQTATAVGVHAVGDVLDDYRFAGFEHASCRR
jgi:hypothetical protein